MAGDLTLSIDVGTGSARAALVAGDGEILSMAAREHDQIVPQFGWAEQRPLDWWNGAQAAIRDALAQVENAAARVAAVCACGQMHGAVLIDEGGRLTRETAPLWNDKRTVALVAEFERTVGVSAYLAESGNPPTPAWPGFKLQWLRDNDPEAYRAARWLLMPKDYINLRLCGQVAMDAGDASCSFLMNPKQRKWSATMVDLLGVDARLLPPIREPLEILGAITDAAACETGLRAGTSVLVGGADYPTAVYGSGACRPGLASDVTGTSCILTLIAEEPLLDPEICNVATIEGRWGPFVLLETGGDAMRWARRALHNRAMSYEEIAANAARAPAGSDGLLFMPYLTGERLGEHRNARAQFFGLGAVHGSEHLDRALMEGVAFAAARHLRIMERAAGVRLERIIASGGGAKTALWLKIKASLYGAPILVPKEPECGVIGCAAMAATALGRFVDAEAAAAHYVRYVEEIAPDPRWAETYSRMQPLFDRLYRHSQSLYDDLDRLVRPERMAII